MKKINPAYFEFMFNYQNAQVDKFWFMPSLSVRELWDTWRLQNSVDLKESTFNLFVKQQDSQHWDLLGQCKDLSLPLPGLSVSVGEGLKCTEQTMQGSVNELSAQPVDIKGAESILFQPKVQKELLLDKTV